VEACAFGWLAKQRILNLPGNIPGVTGANKPVVLGAVYNNL
jgi:anhydro-N-acetylmuramic acid kinase